MRYIKNATLLMLLVAIVGGVPGTASAHRAAAEVTTSPTDSVTYQSTITHDGHVVDPAITLPLTERWSVPAENPSYPIVAQGLVVVTTTNSAAGYGTTRIRAFDQATGSEVWAHDLSGSFAWSNAAYDDGQVFVVNFDGFLRAYDAATGAESWSEQLPSQSAFSSAPTASDGVVYIGGSGGGGTLYAVDESNGDILWTRGVENGDDSSPALSADSVFVSYSCTQSYAFSRSDGAPIWHYAGACTGGGGRTVAYYRWHVYVRDIFSRPGNGVILGANSGQSLGSFSSTTIPAFSHRMAFFLENGTLRGRTLPDLSAVWSFAGDGHLSSAPLVVNGLVFAGSTSGRIYARRARSGQSVWHADVGAAIMHPDEQGVRQPLTGLGAGDGLIVVPAVDRLVAFGSARGQECATDGSRSCWRSSRPRSLRRRCVRPRCPGHLQTMSPIRSTPRMTVTSRTRPSHSLCRSDGVSPSGRPRTRSWRKAWSS
jgi:outer membrane protein assembly factor BamB